jgi:hypothetical protein
LSVGVPVSLPTSSRIFVTSCTAFIAGCWYLSLSVFILILLVDYLFSFTLVYHWLSVVSSSSMGSGEPDSKRWRVSSRKTLIDGAA